MKKTERQAGRTETLTLRRMSTKRKTNISAYKQRERDKYENVKSEVTKEKKRLIEERREEKESDRELLYPIHHVAFKWHRVVTYEGGTQINQTQK